MRPRFCVDWDDTLVEDRWPDQGPWLPGAVDALRELDRHGQVVIFSCRVADYAYPSQLTPEQDRLRPRAEVDNELRRMYDMLEAEGLGHLEIWRRPYKPAATVYIDNRGLRFNGDWRETLEAVYEAIAPMRVVTHDVGTNDVTTYKDPASWDPTWLKCDGEEPSSWYHKVEEPSQAEYYRMLDGYAERTLEKDLQKVAWLEEPVEGYIVETVRHPNSARFHELLEEAGLMHDRKQEDYGKGDDPFANVRSSEEWGLPGWVGAMVRLNDKVRRLQSLRTKGSLANESALDSFMDIAVYALIAYVLYEQEMEDTP